jgi:prepilin-type N-terminal cleavage/methylation domain-containing protein
MQIRHNAGFTLIELSIVLVIIGLIVGGVLVGRDLIHAAAVRATVGQIEKYNAAVNTFRTKYNAVPGDMRPAIATTYGLFALSNPNGNQGMGDNSGVIEDGGCTAGGSNDNGFCGEIPTFWRHLSDANLVEGQFGITGNSLLDPNTGATTAVSNVTQSIPQAKIGRGLMVTVISSRGTNYYDMLPISGLSTGVGDSNGGYTMGTSGMTPTEAQNIDAKIDDGQPETGKVLAQGLVPPVNAYYGGIGSPWGGAKAKPTSTLNNCLIGAGAAATDTYNLIPSTGGNDPSCGLAIRFQ